MTQQQRNKEYYIKNKERILSQQAQWRKENKEHTTEVLKTLHTSIAPGVYMIKNKFTGDFYIGQSIAPYRRKTEHFTKSKTIKKNSNELLQEAMEQYGKEAFVFGIIEHCTEEELPQKELQYIQQYNPTYNQLK